MNYTWGTVLNGRHYIEQDPAPARYGLVNAVLRTQLFVRRQGGYRHRWRLLEAAGIGTPKEIARDLKKQETFALAVMLLSGDEDR